jgi:hypothetical protein
MAASQDLRRILLKIVDGMAFRCFMGAKHRTRKHHASLVSPVPEQPTEIERTLVHVVKSSSIQSYRTPSRQESAGSGSPRSFNSRRSSGHQSKSSVMLSRSSSSEPLALEIERAGALLADAMTKRKMCYSQTPKSSASSLSALSPVSPWAREIRSAEDLVSAARNRLHVLQREQELFNKPRIQPSTVKDERRSMELRRASAIGNHDENVHVVKSSSTQSYRTLSRQESAGSGSPVSFNSRRSSGHQSKSSVMLSRSSSSEPSASEIERAGALLADAMTKRKMCYSQTPKSSASSLSALSPVSPWAREIRSAEDLVSAARNRLHVLQREQELFNKPRIQPSTVKDERRSMELRRASAIGNHDENVVQRSTCRSSGFLSRSPPVAPLHKSFTGAVFSYAPNEFDLCRKRTGMIAYSP